LFLVVNRVQANENAALAVKVVNNVTHVSEFSVRDRESGGLVSAVVERSVGIDLYELESIR
jgi:hypothetical protein